MANKVIVPHLRGGASPPMGRDLYAMTEQINGLTASRWTRTENSPSRCLSGRRVDRSSGVQPLVGTAPKHKGQWA